MNPLGDPGALIGLAHQLDVRADSLAGSAAAVAQRMARSTWTASPRSDRCRNSVAQRSNDATRTANDLHVLANDLRKEAARIEKEIAALKALERRVRNELDRLVKLGLSLPFRTPFDPTRLPRPGDPGWRNVARRLGIGG